MLCKYRVKSIGRYETGDEVFSDYKYFLVNLKPYVPQVTYPKNLARLNRRPHIEFVIGNDEENDAQSFHVQISKSEDFSLVDDNFYSELNSSDFTIQGLDLEVEGWQEIDSSGIVDSSFEGNLMKFQFPRDLDKDSIYYFRVRSKDCHTGDYSDWSSVTCFKSENLLTMELKTPIIQDAYVDRVLIRDNLLISDECYVDEVFAIHPLVTKSAMHFRRDRGVENSSKSAYVSYEFDAQSITIQVKKGDDCAILNVYLDNELHGIIDTYSSESSDEIFEAYSISGLAQGTHTIKIENSGTSNLSSRGIRMRLQGFKVKSHNAVLKVDIYNKSTDEEINWLDVTDTRNKTYFELPKNNTVCDTELSIRYRIWANGVVGDIEIYNFGFSFD